MRKPPGLNDRHYFDAPRSDLFGKHLREAFERPHCALHRPPPPPCPYSPSTERTEKRLCPAPCSRIKEARPWWTFDDAEQIRPQFWHGNPSRLRIFDRTDVAISCIVASHVRSPSEMHPLATRYGMGGPRARSFVTSSANKSPTPIAGSALYPDRRAARIGAAAVCNELCVPVASRFRQAGRPRPQGTACYQPYFRHRISLQLPSHRARKRDTTSRIAQAGKTASGLVAIRSPPHHRVRPSVPPETLPRRSEISPRTVPGRRPSSWGGVCARGRPPSDDRWPPGPIPLRPPFVRL